WPGCRRCISTSLACSPTGSSSRSPKAGLWGPDDGRLSRPVLRAAGGETPPADSPGGEACVAISMSRAERADLGQRGAQPGAARRRTHGDERTTVPVDTAEGGQVVRLAHLLRLNPPDGRSSHIEWQPEGHRRL